MRIVQVGLGGFGKRWAQFARELVVAVVDPDPAARAWATAEFGLPPHVVHADVGHALAADRYDAALVVSTPETHAPIALQALAAGLHVLVEKPLATTIPDGRAMVEAAERAGRVLMVSQNYRFRRPARAMQEAVASGVIGELVAADIVCRRDTRTVFGAGNFRYQMRHPYVLDMAIHHVDLLRAITGREVEWVTARSWPAPDSPYQHHPTMIALFDLAGGVPVRYEGDWATRTQETSWNADWNLIGSVGELAWIGDVDDPAVGEVTLRPWRWGEPIRTLPQPDLAATDQRGTLAAFIDAVERGLAPETSGADNLRSLAIVLACVESIEQGTSVSIADVLAR